MKFIFGKGGRHCFLTSFDLIDNIREIRKKIVR